MNLPAGVSAEMIVALARELRALAKAEDDRAAAEAADVPYWIPCPSSVLGARAAARTLRVDAEALDALLSPRPLAC
jgi:hypothetical protein